MKQLHYIKGSKLFTSDWHIFHKNIWKYENRFNFLNINNLTGEEFNNKFEGLAQEARDKKILDLDFKFYNKYFEILKKDIEKYGITEFYNLGDFIFELNDCKLARFKNYKMYKLLRDFFNYLKDKKIKTTLILGNHETLKESHPLSSKFYKQLFGVVEPWLYLFKNGKPTILISHVPINRFKIESKGSAQNFLLTNQMLEQSKKIDKLINIHGHTHSNQPLDLIEGDKDVIYINSCIDYYLNINN